MNKHLAIITYLRVNSHHAASENCKLYLQGIQFLWEDNRQHCLPQWNGVNSYCSLPMEIVCPGRSSHISGMLKALLFLTQSIVASDRRYRFSLTCFNRGSARASAPWIRYCACSMPLSLGVNKPLTDVRDTLCICVHKTPPFISLCIYINYLYAPMVLCTYCICCVNRRWFP